MTDDKPLFGVSAAARGIEKAEGTVRRLERQGVVHAVRDSAGRRLFTREQIEVMRAHVKARHAA